MRVIGLALLCIFRLSTIRALNYTLLPLSSEYCKANRESTFTPGKIVARQMQLHANDARTNYSASTNYYNLYLCQPKFIPLGKIVQWPMNEGYMGTKDTMTFWYLRMRISGHFSDCKSQLVITERHQSSGHIDDHKTPPLVHKYDCKSQFPIVLNATYRKIEFKWETDANLERESDQANYVMVEISKYARFSGNASMEARRNRCKNGQDMFFCPGADACIPGTAVCDTFDDCFDGATDEQDCDANLTDTKPRTEHVHGSWMTNLPWIALGILPVILVFALARICSQKRSLDIGEDYKMGFNTEDEEDGEEDAIGTAARSDRSCSPGMESGRMAVCGHDDYADEGYTLPRHEKTMSASSDYLPANFVELTATPAHRGRRPESERAPRADSPAAKTEATPSQQRVAVQINNPVYGNNVYVDVPTSQTKVERNDYTRPGSTKNAIASAAKAEDARALQTNGQEEYTPLLPPSPPGTSTTEASTRAEDTPELPSFHRHPPVVPNPGRSNSGSGCDDYEDEPPPYDEIFVGPGSGPPTTSPSDCEGGSEMLRLKPLPRPAPAVKSAAPPAPNGATNSRDSDYDKNYIVV